MATRSYKYQVFGNEQEYQRDKTPIEELQSLSKEVDTHKKKVSKFCDESKRTLSIKKKPDNLDQRFHTVQDRLEELVSETDSFILRVEELNEEEEGHRGEKFEERKSDELRRLNAMKAKLEKVRDELEPWLPKDLSDEKEGEGEEDEEEEDDDDEESGEENELGEEEEIDDEESGEEESIDEESDEEEAEPVSGKVCKFCDKSKKPENYDHKFRTAHEKLEEIVSEMDSFIQRAAELNEEKKFDARRSDELKQLRAMKAKLEKVRDKLEPNPPKDLSDKEEEEDDYDEDSDEYDEEESEEEDEEEEDEEEKEEQGNEEKAETVSGIDIHLEEKGNGADDENESEEDDDEEVTENEEEPVTISETMRQYVVLEDLKAEDECDLPIKKGEILTIIDIKDDGWYRAQNGEGKQGLVPSTYLKIYGKYGDVQQNDKGKDTEDVEDDIKEEDVIEEEEKEKEMEINETKDSTRLIQQNLTTNHRGSSSCVIS